MNILILGIDGYLGHALKEHLKEKGHHVWGLDNGLRRKMVKEVGSDSITPLSWTPSPYIDLLRWDAMEKITELCIPDVVIHFAEQPSAPYSLKGHYEAFMTQHNNIGGTMNVLWWLKRHPEVHLIKLGSMGVYGTPDEDIPEVDGPIAYDPGSFYHISKAADSLNVRKACQWWGLRATDIHQGVVYGNINGTRLDYDSYFGTAVNRFIAQAVVGHPLTVYGDGSQTRGYLSIKDTMRCIELAIENPPEGYRVFNQFTEIFSVQALAEMVAAETGATIDHLDNPRVERVQHPYAPTHKRLPELGLVPHLMKDELPDLIGLVRNYKHRINPKVITPKTTWR